MLGRYQECSQTTTLQTALESLKQDVNSHDKSCSQNHGCNVFLFIAQRLGSISKIGLSTSIRQATACKLIIKTSALELICTSICPLKYILSANIITHSRISCRHQIINQIFPTPSLPPSKALQASATEYRSLRKVNNHRASPQESKLSLLQSINMHFSYTTKSLTTESQQNEASS